MARIQVDMFEVQLGAALLLQFQGSTGRPVRVLADAGIRAPGYPLDHVHRKLPEALASFGDPTPRLDLVIGTHYDADHLDGLVPIIADESIEIGEAWLPPVADDVHVPRGESEPGEHLLALRLAAPGGRELLADYLRAKQAICRDAAELEHVADEYRSGRTPRSLHPTIARDAPPAGDDLDAWLQVFRAHEADAADTLGPEAGDLTHAAPVPDDPDALAHAAAVRSGPPWPDGSELADLLRARWSERSAPPPVAPPAPREDEGRTRAADERTPTAADWDAANLAAVRRAAAHDAISAISLAKVVDALVARGIPIRCPIIEDGVPARFGWRSAEGRFVPHRARNSRGPMLELLGPSRGLVRRHQQRLPIGTALQRSAEAQIPLLGVTPSNQLSFVARLDFAGEAILVAGDTGFVDFTGPDGAYYPELLDELRSLDVIQVAHHAGNNGHFYRALLGAGYGRQRRHSLLLVSHATHDPHRPSPAFGMFMEQVRRGAASIVFTSEPTASRVSGFRDAMHPLVGQRADVGDVRAQFDGARWTVTRHSIAV